MQAISEQAFRVELDLVLAHFATVRQYIRDTIDRHQQQFHDPVVETAQSQNVVLLRIVGAQDVLEYLPKSGGVGSHFRYANAIGYLFACRLQAFEYQLPGKIDIGAFLEHDRDNRKPGLRDGAHLFDVGERVHHCFDRERDELFDFFRRQPARFRVDLHLHIGHIRKRVKVQFRQDERAAHQGGQQGDYHQQPIFDAEVDEFIQHDSSSS